MAAPFLYLITPPVIADAGAFAAGLKAVLAAGAPYVSAVQLRLKSASDHDIRRISSLILPVIKIHDVMAILNDRANLAAELGFDGVHLGQTDGSVAEARRLMGKGAIIGVTCHGSKDLAIKAAEDGADYLAFGAFYPTTTKAVEHHAKSGILTWAQDFLTLPVVAIGGITAQTAPELLKAGADMVAVSSAIWSHPQGPATAVTGFVKSAVGVKNSVC